MKITKISAYQYEWVCIEEEGMKISKNRFFTTIEGRVVKIETDAGLTGWGEVVPHGNLYLQAFVGAVLPGLDIIVPPLIGQDPRNVEEIYHTMDSNLLDHGYIKSPVDMACWDILGKSLDQPVYELMGGMQTENPRVIAFLHRDFQKYEPQILENLEKFRKAGCKRIQTKASGGPWYAIEYIEFIAKHLKADESLWLDCNRAWTVNQAVRVADAAKKLGVSLYYEQPCDTIDQCREVMTIAAVPVIIDERIMNMHDMARIAAHGGCSAVSIKIGRVGGLTKAKQIRDFCQATGITIDIHTINSAQIGDSMTAHLAHSTLPETLGYVYAGQLLTSTVLADDGAKVVEPWYLVATDQPGFGVTPKASALTHLKTWQ